MHGHTARVKINFCSHTLLISLAHVATGSVEKLRARGRELEHMSEIKPSRVAYIIFSFTGWFTGDMPAYGNLVACRQWEGMGREGWLPPLEGIALSKSQNQLQRKLYRVASTGRHPQKREFVSRNPCM